MKVWHIFFGWTNNESIFSEINCIFRLFFCAFHFFGALIPNVQICWLLPRIQRSFLAGCSDHSWSRPPKRMTIGEAVESQKLRSWIVLAHLGTSSDYLDLFDFSLEDLESLALRSQVFLFFLKQVTVDHLYTTGRWKSHTFLGLALTRSDGEQWDPGLFHRKAQEFDLVYIGLFEFKVQAGPQCLEVHAEPFSFATLRTWHSKNSSIEIPEPMDSFAIFFAMPARTYLFLTSIGIKADHCRFRLGTRLSKVSQFHPKSGRINPNYCFLAGHFEKHLAEMASQDPGYFIFRDLMLHLWSFEVNGLIGSLLSASSATPNASAATRSAPAYWNGSLCLRLWKAESPPKGLGDLL